MATSSNIGLFINSQTGYVGIGTGNPANALQVKANNNTTGVVIDQTGTGDILDIRNAGVSKMIVDANGNVGIGTGIPLNALQVKANNNTTGVVIDQTGTGGILDIRDAGVSKMIVDANGNVGIGTMNPIHTLHVKANTNTTGVVIDQTGTGGILDVRDAGVSKMIVDANGNVGIGTGIPMSKLDIAGNVNVSGRILGTQTLIGFYYHAFSPIAYPVSTSWSSIVSQTYTPKSVNSTLIIQFSGVLRIFSGSGNSTTSVQTYVNNSTTNVSGSSQFVSHNQSIDLLTPFSSIASYTNTSITTKTIQLYGIVTGTSSPNGDIRNPVVYIQEINN